MFSEDESFLLDIIKDTRLRQNLLDIREAINSLWVDGYKIIQN